MESCSQTQSTIQWTRKFVVTLSIIIIVMSLSQYRKETVSVFTLLSSNRDVIANNINEDFVNSNRTHSFGQALLQDRRLITTLVAAQTSIFCPLFLLVENAVSSINHYHASVDQRQKYLSSSVVSFWKTTLYFVCQMIMPLGLAVSWLFCLSFDHKTSHLIRIYFSASDTTDIVRPSSSYSIWYFAPDFRCDMSINLLEGLKYLTTMILALEMILVCIAWIQYCLSKIDRDDCKELKPIRLV